MADTDDKQVEDAQPTPGSPEHDQAMAAKYRESRDDHNPYVEAQSDGDGGSQEPTKPDGVPDKFWNPETGEVDHEGILKAHNELERKLGEQAGDGADVDPNEAAENAAKAAEQIEEVVDKAGLDTNALQSKILENGDIDASDYEALAKIGIPAELARQHVSMLKRQADDHFDSVMTYGGGEEQVQGLLDWAAQSLSPEEIRGYNQMLAGPMWKSAIDTLQAKQAASSKTAAEPSLTSGGNPGGFGSVGYQSRDDQQVDLRNPLYREMSPAGEKFRQEVFRKTRLATWNKQ